MPEGGFVTQLSKELFCLLETIYTLTQFVHKNESQTVLHKKITAKTLLSEKKRRNIQWNTVYTVPNGPKKFGLCFFFTRKCMAVLPGSQSGRNNELTELPRLP